MRLNVTLYLYCLSYSRLLPLTYTQHSKKCVDTFKIHRFTKLQQPSTSGSLVTANGPKDKNVYTYGHLVVILCYTKNVTLKCRTILQDLFPYKIPLLDIGSNVTSACQISYVSVTCCRTFKTCGFVVSPTDIACLGSSVKIGYILSKLRLPLSYSRKYFFILKAPLISSLRRKYTKIK